MVDAEATHVHEPPDELDAGHLTSALPPHGQGYCVPSKSAARMAGALGSTRMCETG